MKPAQKAFFQIMTNGNRGSPQHFGFITTILAIPSTDEKAKMFWEPSLSSRHYWLLKANVRKRENVPSDMCAQRRLKSACGSVQFDQSSLSPETLHLLAIQTAASEDSNQIVRMRMLIWIFAGRTCWKVRFLTFQHTLKEKLFVNWAKSLLWLFSVYINIHIPYPL